MKPDEKKVVAVSVIAILVVAGGFILFSSNLFACLGQSCIGQGDQNPVTGTQNIYIDISTTSGILSYNVGGNILPNAGTTGELVKSCQWITCALDGVEVTNTIVVSGPKSYSTTWTFRLANSPLGGDKEEYVWLVPGLPAGTYTVTVTAQEAGALQTAKATATFTVPLSNIVQLSGG